MNLRIFLLLLIVLLLAHFQPELLLLVVTDIALEQFGYGFGFAAYLLYMIHMARGQHRTAHYAICIGFMALGMMLPEMGSGWLQEAAGYQEFFLWVMLATLPGFAICVLIPLEREFGKRTDAPG